MPSGWSAACRPTRWPPTAPTSPRSRAGWPSARFDHAHLARGPAGLHRLARARGRAAALHRAAALQLPPFLPLLSCARACIREDPDRADRHAEDRALAAEVPHGGGGRVAARRAGGDRSARQSRPHHARGAVCHGPAGLGAGEPAARPGQPQPGRDPHPRQGQPRAADSARRGGGALADGLRARAARGDPARAADRLSLSDPARRSHDAPGVLAHHQALRAQGGHRPRSSRRTRCAMPSRRTCSITARTCVWCRCCWDTAICRPLRSIRTLRASG